MAAQHAQRAEQAKHAVQQLWWLTTLHSAAPPAGLRPRLRRQPGAQQLQGMGARQAGRHTVSGCMLRLQRLHW